MTSVGPGAKAPRMGRARQVRGAGASLLTSQGDLRPVPHPRTVTQ